MKKSLIALSVLAAISGVAHAQSNVTVYGVVDMALQGESRGNGKTFAADSGEQSGSRLGFKGSEDLGNGLKAIFALEMGINADTGKSSQGGLAFGRQSWVGLTGDFGTVKLGRQYSPMFIAMDSVDPWDAGITTGHAGAGTSTGGILTFFMPQQNWRLNNSVGYASNAIEGFSANGVYSFGEVTGNNNANREVGAAGQYDGGKALPLFATVAYHRANDASGNSLNTWFVGGTYDFGMVKAHAAYGKNSSDARFATAGGSVAEDDKEFMLAATVPVTAEGSIIASVVRVTNNLAATANVGTQWALGYTYALSKRTNLYTSYSRTNNNNNSNAGGLAAGNGLTDHLANVGIRQDRKSVV